MFHFGNMRKMVPEGGKGLVKKIKPRGSPEGTFLNISTPPPPPNDHLIKKCIYV